MKNTRLLAVSGLLTALIALCSLTSIPMPSGTPVTLQTFAVAFVAYMLGVRGGLLCVGAYLLLGAVGLPVFSGLTGGAGRLVGLTGGFLWGFLAMVAITGLGAGKPVLHGVLWGVLGLIACHIAGVLQFAAVSGNGIVTSFLIASLPYMVKDVLSVIGAMYLARLLRRRTRILGG